MPFPPWTAAVVALAFTLGACASRHGAAPHATTPHWDYGPEHGPAHWAALHPGYAACATGRRQSPIDIVPGETAAASGPTTELRAVHRDHPAEIVNNGHTVQIADAGAEDLTIGGESYALVQYHFHSPSENTVGGRRYPMEMHLVHASAGGRLAVLGVFIEAGAENAAFAPLWSHLPPREGAKVRLDHFRAGVDALLPSRRAAWRFDGSLTTPPCTEGVQWLVFTQPVTMSERQIAAFRAVIDGNSRPTQPRNGRVVAGGVITAR